MLSCKKRAPFCHEWCPDWCAALQFIQNEIIRIFLFSNILKYGVITTLSIWWHIGWYVRKYAKPSSKIGAHIHFGWLLEGNQGYQPMYLISCVNWNEIIGISCCSTETILKAVSFSWWYTYKPWYIPSWENKVMYLVYFSLKNPIFWLSFLSCISLLPLVTIHLQALTFGYCSK